MIAISNPHTNMQGQHGPCKTLKAAQNVTPLTALGLW